jgi:hypothetical protein
VNNLSGWVGVMGGCVAVVGYGSERNSNTLLHMSRAEFVFKCARERGCVCLRACRLDLSHYSQYSVLFDKSFCHFFCRYLC